MELVRIRILSADPDPGGKMKVDPCWCLMPSSAFVFYLTPGFVMFELRRTLLFEKNLVWIQIRKRKNRILVEKGWTVYALVTSYFEPIPGSLFERDTFWCKNQSLLHFFELGIWCLLRFLSMNYSLIFKGCWKLFRREKKPDLVVFRRFKSGLSVLHFNLCWYWSDFRFNALWESHQIRVTWSAKTQLSLNPDSQRKEIARWPGTGSRFRLFESHIFLGEMFFLYTVGMIFWSWLLGLSWRALSLPLNSDPDSIPSTSIELLSIRLRLGIFSDWILKISRKLFLWLAFFLYRANYRTYIMTSVFLSWSI